jgi:hypothetical protein
MVIGAAVLLLVPLGGEADSANDDVEHNQRLLDKLRKDPPQYERLRQSLAAFLALPQEHQEKLRQLDQELHDKSSKTAARLQRVLERYADWLQSLSETDRQRIQDESDPKKRLQLIRDVRERLWVNRLPKAIRDELEKLTADQRRVRIVELRKDDRRRHGEWQTAIRNWAELTQRPQTSLKDLAPDVKSFVDEFLLPVLSAEENKRLQQAQGKNPGFLKTLVELADKHPLKLPGPPTGPSKFEQLPAGVQARLKKAKDWPSEAAKKAEGKWPDYAFAVMEFVRVNKLGPLPKQLGPSHPSEFPASIAQFIDKQLIPILKDDELAALKKFEGRWPGYPRQVLTAARKHNLQVPGMGLPGPRQMWDRYRPAPTASAEAPSGKAD